MSVKPNILVCRRNHLIESIFLSQTLILLNCLIMEIIFSVLFYNTCLNRFSISCLSFGGITISATFFEFISYISFDFTILSAILLPVNFPVA